MDDLVSWLRAQIDADAQILSAACLHIDDCNDSGFTARFDDEHLLAEIEAKRRILDEAESYSPELEHGDNGEWAFETVVRLLAQPYADRPGWRAEWAS